MKKLVLDLQFFAEGDPAPQEGEKTFSQEDVNRIVQERLAKEKGRISQEREAEYSKRENELNRRELKLKAREVLSEENLPCELLEVLNYSDEESFLKSIDIIKKHITPKQNKPQEPRYTTAYTPAGGNTSEPDPLRKAMGLS